jgi:NAD(P)-dependent dehydrogenase (short-subunit alcohol dehydrogenase family)
MAEPLAGKVALITGGASGLGLAVLRRFLAAGARCAILDRSAAGLRAVHDEFGGAVPAIEGDVTSYADNARAVEQTVAAHGKLDILIGNAGIFDNYATLATLPEDKIEAAFDELFGIDVKGYLLAAKAALGELKRNRGNIVFTASISSFRPAFGGVLYIPAKHAVAGLTRRLALELAPEVRVNAVAPGYVATNLAGLSSVGQERKDPAAPPPLERFPLRFHPTPDDYTGFYLMLASPEARAMTGQVLLADCGAALMRGGAT